MPSNTNQLTPAGYRALMRRVRSAAKDGATRQWHAVACEQFTANGRAFVVMAKRLSAAPRAAHFVETAPLDIRESRMFTCDALEHAATFRRAIATRPPSDRARTIETARAFLSFAADYRTASISTPG